MIAIWGMVSRFQGYAMLSSTKIIENVMHRLLIILLLLFTQTIFADTPPPPANEMFKPRVKVIDPNTILLEWDIENGAYLYRDRISLINTDKQSAELGKLIYPDGELKQDQILGEYEIYRQTVALPVPILGLNSGDVEFKLRYQGCTDQGFCYPPSHCVLTVSLDQENGVIDAKLAPPKTKTLPSALTSDVDRASALLDGHDYFWIVLGFIGFGLLLAFTPCVLPMVPVLSGLIIGHGRHITTGKAFTLSLIYVSAMAITYAIAGVIVASLGSNLQVMLQTPLAISLFALVFVLLALSMFGLYELKLPTSWQVALSKLSQRQQGGAYIGVALMGCLSTLILSPCVTAPLVGVLGYIAGTGDKLLGAIALFSLGIGMGLPLLMIGTAAGKWLPKAGMWMNQVKILFGVMMLGVAVYLIERLLPSHVGLILWGALIAGYSVFLGALRKADDEGWARVKRGVAYIGLVYGTVLVVGGAMGNDDMLAPLKRQPTTMMVTQDDDMILVKTVSELQQQLNRARQLQTPVLIDFYADWCVACKVMERTTLSDEKVSKILTKFIVIKVDVTNSDSDAETVMQAFNVIAPPTYIMLDQYGSEVANTRVVGEMNAADFSIRLETVINQRE